MASDDVLQLLDDEPAVPAAGSAKPWTILIVDDDDAVHESTRFALYNYSLNGRSLRVLSAYSAEEGRRLLEREPDIAVVFLDVVMESDDAGLRLVGDIRERLGNDTVRIVLRTGQPGQAPERRVVLDYDINDYKSKTELTADKLFTTLTAALRSYQQLRRITAMSRGLGIIVDAASLFFEDAALRQLAEGVLARMEDLLGTRTAGLLVMQRAGETWQRAKALAGRGRFSGFAGTDILHLPPALQEPMREALTRGAHDFDSRPSLIHMRTASGHGIVIALDAERVFSEIERELVEVFCGRLALAFDNALLQEALREANAGLERRVAQRTAELSRANQRLAAQRTSLRRANSFKSEMLGTVAHDLKNPLGVILGRTEILQDLIAFEQPPVEKMQQQLQHIRDCARRLTSMVDDLMVDAMNDALDIAVRREPIDLAALAAEVVAANRPLAERKRQKIGLAGLPSLVVDGDQERLREAIENLVGNAIKYSAVGGTIEVGVSRDGEHAVCAVRDDGPGLSPEDIGRVFGRFQRLSAKPTGGESSTGLGLSIVKRIAELHEGQARAQSLGPGRGAVFSLHVPIARAAAA